MIKRVITILVSKKIYVGRCVVGAEFGSKFETLKPRKQISLRRECSKGKEEGLREANTMLTTR